MTQECTVARESAANVAIVGSSEGLEAIRKPGCAAAIWHRRPDPGFQAWIDGLNPEMLPVSRVVLPPGRTPEALRQICDLAGLPASPHLDRWIDDMSNLAGDFAQQMEAPLVRLRLAAVTTNACRKFHVDAVVARLICTYRGTGTQYGIANNGAEPHRVFTVPTGCPIVLRGMRWPGDPRSGLHHRSPPIAGTGETRAVLVVDPVLDSEDDF